MILMKDAKKYTFYSPLCRLPQYLRESLEEARWNSRFLSNKWTQQPNLQ